MEARSRAPLTGIREKKLTIRQLAPLDEILPMLHQDVVAERLLDIPKQNFAEPRVECEPRK